MDYPHIRRIDGRFADIGLEEEFQTDSWPGTRLQIALTLLAFSLAWTVSTSSDIAYLRDTPLFLPTVGGRLAAAAAGLTAGLWLLLGKPGLANRWTGPVVHGWAVVSTLAAVMVAAAFPAVETTPDGLADVLVFTSFWMSLHIIVLGVALASFPWAVLLVASGYIAAYLTLAIGWNEASEHAMVSQSVMLVACAAFGWIMAIMLSTRARRRFYITKRYEEAKEVAEDAREFTTFLLAATGHDIRQPVYALDLNASLLTRLIEDRQWDRALEMSRQQQLVTRNVSRMLASILEVSHLDARKRLLAPRELAAGELIASLAASFREIARHREITLRSVASSTTAFADPGVVEHILANLVSNAISHSQGHRLLLGVRPQGDQIEFVVADDGRGLPAGDADLAGSALLHPGRRDAGRRRTGMGMEIMFRLAERGGLRLRLRSRAGHGVMATLACPRAQIPAATAD